MRRWESSGCCRRFRHHERPADVEERGGAFRCDAWPAKRASHDDRLSLALLRQPAGNLCSRLDDLDRLCQVQLSDCVP